MDDSSDVLSAARQLAETVRDSRLYRDYRRSRIRVEAEPLTAGRLLAYKKAQAAYEYKRLRNEQASNTAENLNEEKNLSHLQAELMLNPDAREFLLSEAAFLKVYLEICDILTESCEIDIFGA